MSNDHSPVATALGIDIGGSGMKAAPVDLISGELLDKRHRIPTPQPATPDAMAEVAGELAKSFSWSGPIGCAFPGVVQANTIRTAANLDPSWVGVDAAEVFGASTGQAVTMVNDADAAGIAEMAFGAGRGRAGVVMMITLGTGIGTAMFANGTLVPNTELGHLILDGVEAEETASARAREDGDLSWADWAPYLDAYLHEIERLLWPELMIIGGGVSSKFAKYSDALTVNAEVVPAELRNQAGIVGAAVGTRSVLGSEGPATNG